MTICPKRLVLKIQDVKKKFCFFHSAGHFNETYCMFQGHEGSWKVHFLGSYIFGKKLNFLLNFDTLLEYLRTTLYIS